MSKRIVTVFSTQGANKQKFEIGEEVTSWGQLSTIVGSQYDLNKLIATESVTKHDLVSSEAILPQSDFKLFLRPKKTKSGLEVSNATFAELRAIVKENRDNDAFMEHLHSGMGKNYTQFTTDELRSQIASWNPGGSDSEMTDEQKIDKIKSLANEITQNGNFIVTVDVEEGCDEECQEDKTLAEEAENLLKTFN